MRFLLDMGISPRLAERLRELTHDAVHLRERNCAKSSDIEILRMALDEERVVLTHDLDFADLMAASKARLPSVVIFRLRNMRPESVERHLLAAIAQHETALTRGAILSVTESQIRIRGLPLRGSADRAEME